MKLREMIEWFAAATGLSEATVNETARALQKAGWVKKGQQGRYGGAEMDEGDAAALLLAILAATPGKRRVVDAGEIVSTISALKVYQIYEVHDPEVEHRAPIEELLGLPPGHRLGDLIRRLITCEPAALQNASNFVLGYEIRAKFPSLTITASFAYARPRRPIEVVYWDPRIESRPELAVSGSETLRKRFWSSDAFTIERTFRDRFFTALHRELFHQGIQP